MSASVQQTRKRKLEETEPETHLGEPLPKAPRIDGDTNNVSPHRLLQKDLRSLESPQIESIVAKIRAQNADGWIDISVVQSRLSQNIKYDLITIIALIQQSLVLECDTDNNAVRLIPIGKFIDDRTSFFASGFPPRLTFDQLSAFWKQRCGDETVIRMVGSPFIGTVLVKVSSQHLLEQLRDTTIDYKGRTIICGPASQYKNARQFSIIESQSLYPFISDRIICLSNVGSHATSMDIQNWVLNAYHKQSCRNSLPRCRVDSVWKAAQNSDECYVRLHSKSGVSASQLIPILEKRPFMGVFLNVSTVDDDTAVHLWPKIAIKRNGAKVVKDVIMRTDK